MRKIQTSQTLNLHPRSADSCRRTRATRWPHRFVPDAISLTRSSQNTCPAPSAPSDSSTMRSAFSLAVLLVAFPVSALWQIQTAPTTAGLRGIHALGNGIAWASGTEGIVLRTTSPENRRSRFLAKLVASHACSLSGSPTNQRNSRLYSSCSTGIRSLCTEYSICSKSAQQLQKGSQAKSSILQNRSRTDPPLVTPIT